MPRKAKTTITKNELERLYCHDRLTFAEISARTGVPCSTLNRWHKGWGLPLVQRSASYKGKRFGRWVVLTETVGGKRGAPSLCHCRCDCGQESDVPRGNLQQGVSQSCGCLHRLPEGRAGFNKVIDGYKRSARKRGLNYDLEDEQAYALTKMPCHYCGAPPNQIRQERSQRSRYVYSGIDRLDNDRGYIEGNVAPACWVCNRRKANQSVSEFFAWVEALHAPVFTLTQVDATLPPRFRVIRNNYQSKARWRGLAFKLTGGQLELLFESDCAFCGVPPSNGGAGVRYTGIDRVDNAKGYETGNCVPSCFHCNHAKLDGSVGDLLDWAQRVRSHQSTATSQR